MKIGIFGPKRIAVSSCAEAGYDIFAGRGKLRQPIDPSAPVLERVTALEVVVAQIDAGLDGAFKEIDQRTSELKTKRSTEAAAREHSIGGVKRSLESTATGNYAPLAFGAFWLGVGVVLATLAPEIALAAAGRWAELWARS